MTMKRLRKLLPMLMLCLILAACGGGGGAEITPAADVTAAQAAQAVWNSQPDREGLEALEGDGLSGHLADFCGLEDWEEGAVYAASGVDAREITVVLLPDEDAAQAAGERLEAYRQSRQGDFFGYAPEEAERLDKAAVLTVGTGRRSSSGRSRQALPAAPQKWCAKSNFASRRCKDCYPFR